MKFRPAATNVPWVKKKILDIGSDEEGDVWLCNEDGLLARVRDGRVPLRGTEGAALLIQRQIEAIERLKKAEQRVIPDWFDYAGVSGLSREMKETLAKFRPETIGQAGRIPGVTPAAVALVNVFLEIQGRRRQSLASAGESAGR